MSRYTKSGIRLPREPERRPRRDGKRWSPTMGIGALVNPDGSIEWQDDEWMPNALNDEGETSMLNVYLREQANVAKWLCLIEGNTTAPTETSTMAYLGGGAGAREVRVPTPVDGYDRKQILSTDWSVPALDAGDSQTSAAEKTFGPASGSNWTNVTHSGLVTAATGQTGGSGLFLLFLALSANTTIAVGQSFKYILRWKQQ